MFDEKGSVVVFVGFVLAIAVGGLLLSLLSFVPANIVELNVIDTSDIQIYSFLIFFWKYILPTVIFIGATSWFLARLQKKEYEMY